VRIEAILKRNKENKIYGKKESGSGDCPAIRSLDIKYPPSV